ncbi:MAG: SIMPL domain-containing protein, partial [Treponemataceae bacterium]|nr:SIMPL domain-containing protein [Treponemataceae bacterium]
LSVVTRKNSVTEASAENARRMADVQKAILDAGIPEESWSTSNYTIYQENSYVNGRSVPGDYRVSNMLTVVLKDVTKAGSVIDAAIAAGANELTSLSFSVSDTSEAEDQARVLAVEQARHAAEILAESGGARLGRLLSISEESYSQPALQSNRLLTAGYADGGTPVTAGKSTVTVTVRATFALR